MLLEDAFNPFAVRLEPRLQEYILKKKFNKANHINPDIPVEKEFCITPYDITVINEHLGGKKKNKFKSKMKNENCDYFVKPDFSSFNTVDFKSDERYKRLQKKNIANANAKNQISNMSHMDPEYTIIQQSNPFQEHVGLSKCDMYLDSRDLAISPSRPYIDKPDRNKYCYNINNKSNKNPNVYNNPPKISYNQYLQSERINAGLPYGDPRELAQLDSIGQLNEYTSHLNETYLVDENDNANNYNQQNIKNKRSQLFLGNGYPDISVEESLRGCYVDSSKKSVGFRNAFENQFSYISDDICDPDHTVMAWPANSRGTNKEIARAGRFR